MASCHGILLFNLSGLQEEFYIYEHEHLGLAPQYRRTPEDPLLLKFMGLFIGRKQALEPLKF